MEKETKMNWQKLCWKITDWKKIKSIVVEFSLITDSGHKLMRIEREIPLTKLIPVYNDWRERLDKEKDLSEKNRELFNKMAKEILVEHQKKKIRHLTAGKCYSGKFVVKCIWEVNLELEKMTFEEYREAGKILKEAERKEKEKKRKEKKKNAKQ
jgi:hypothetical protein